MIRQKKGLSQVELARRARITQGFVAQVERGYSTPSLATLRRIAKALGVKVAELL